MSAYADSLPPAERADFCALAARIGVSASACNGAPPQPLPLPPTAPSPDSPFSEADQNFDGGQNPGESYRVNGTLPAAAAGASIVVVGPVEAMRWEPVVGTNPQRFEWAVYHALGRDICKDVDFDPNGAREEELPYRSFSVRLMDGTPDTSPGPAPAAAPAAIPVPSTPAYRSPPIGVPAWVPASAPSPASIPGTAPVPAPVPNPSEAPAPGDPPAPAPAPAPAPGTLPQSDPAAPPAPAPGSVPGPAPSTSPNPAPSTSPGTIPGTAPTPAPGTEPAPAPGDAPAPADPPATVPSSVPTTTPDAPPAPASVPDSTTNPEAVPPVDPTSPGDFFAPLPIPAPAPVETPQDNKCKCNASLEVGLNNNSAQLTAMQGQLTAIQANQTNSVSGFAALQRGQAGIMSYLGTMQAFAAKAWAATHMDKVINALNLITALHNASMLSRDLAETLFYLISSGLDAIGVEDSEGNPLDIGGLVGGAVNTFVRNLLGDAFIDGALDAYRRANRIVQSASAIIWTVRSLIDTSLDLLEWIGENTGKIGNALKAFGVVGERAYPDMSERPRAAGRLRTRIDKRTGQIENLTDRVDTYTQATSAVVEIQEETGQLIENFGQFSESVTDAIPDPWLDNGPIANQNAAASAASASPPVTPDDAQRS